MTSQTQFVYSKPPVLEAVIGITFAEPIDESALAVADRRFDKHYIVHSDNEYFDLLMSTTVGVGNRPIVGAKGISVKGHRRTTPSMDEIAVLMPDSLTVSKLAPYTGWDDFFSRFMRDFAWYKRPGTHRPISRVGVRYINRIDIPATSDIVEHEQYLDVYPRVPVNFGPLTGFSMQAQFKIDRFDGHATLNSAPVEPVTLRHASFVIDIDVYKTISTPLSEDGLAELLHLMREEKNRLFESSITQRAREELFGYASN